MAEPISSFGSKVKVGDGADPEVFVDIPGLGDFDWPEAGPQTQNVTAHDSPGARVEKISTIIDSGTVTIPINKWDPSDPVHAGLYADALARTRRIFQMWTPDETSFGVEFGAYVRISGASPVEGALNASLTLDVATDVPEATAPA